MTATTAVPLLPESAPFSAKQRAWLNGFFAGLISTRQTPGSTTPLPLAPALGRPLSPPSAAATTATTATTATAAAGVAGGAVAAAGSWRDVVADDVSQYRWHQADLSLDERMELAEGQPLELQLMAAMAQLDCGQCGYQCRTYAKAIETGEETDLKKCTPGGKPTSRMLIQLSAQRSSPAPRVDSAQRIDPAAATDSPPLGGNGSAAGVAAVAGVAAAAGVTAVAAGDFAALGGRPLAIREPHLAFSRQNPFPASATEVIQLTGKGSAKDVRLVSLSLAGSGLSYQVGDALGVFPKNGKEQVEAILRLIGADGSQPTRTPDGFSTTLRGALAEQCDIKTVSDELLQCLLGNASDPQDRRLLERCLADEPVEGLFQEPRVIDLLARFRRIPISGEQLIQSLDSLKPRLYSIASSPLVQADRVDLVVGVVRYVLDGQPRQGTASTFLANRMLGYDPVPVFVQPCHHFSLPRDPHLPVIMIGPGTGIAPFRGFLQQRRATAAAGENWLFFGEQHCATDFLLRDELAEMQRSGLLTHLSTAFSRDQQQRVYVQHRLLEQADRIWQWLGRGAHLYLCGDAARMAVDVDRALHRVVATAGGLSDEDAAGYLKELARCGRYQKDVY